jgi:hypothetical protein
MKTITHQELIQRIMEREKRGACFVSLLTETDPKMRKTGNPHLGTIKVTEINGSIGADYESCVNRQQAREYAAPPGFTAKAHVWGEHYQGSRSILENNGKFYLALRPNPNNTPKVRYVKNGVEVAKELLEAFLPDRKAKLESLGARQKLDLRPVEWLTYSLSSIRTITMDGETLNVIG